MAKNETYFTDIKKCVMDGVRGGRAAYNREEAMMMVYNGKVVFNRALYSIEAFDAIVPAEGASNMKGACLVDSIKKDHDGTETYVDYTISPESIEANETDKEKSGFYTVTQNVTGLHTTGKYTQPAETFLGYVYLNLQVKSVLYMYAPASGGFIYPTVSYSGTRRAIYSSGRKVDEAWSGVTENLISATGRALVTGATFNSIGDNIGAVYAPDLGTTESESRAVAEITALKIEAIDGTILSWSGKEYSYQFENVKTTTYSTPVITATYTDIGANGSAAVLSIAWTQIKTEGFSSGADEVVTPLSGTISNSATSGNRITSISGTRYLTGATLTTTSGSASRGNITASSLGYTKKDRTKAYDVSVTVSVNGKSESTSVTVYQQANAVSSYYTQPEITSVTAGDVGAGGSAATISVEYSQYLHTYSTANPTGKDTDCGSITTPLTVMGEAVTNNGRKSGVSIIADSWGTSVQSRTIVYKVLSVSIDANGESGFWSGTLNVYQAANAVTNTTYGAYSLSITSSSETMVSDGGSVTISASCLRAATYTYTSGSTRDVNLNADATIKTSLGTLSSSTINGYGSATLTIPENTGSARNITITITAADGTTKKTTTIAQNAVRYSFYSNTLAAIGAAGGDMILQVVSTRNDKSFAITTSNIAVTGLTGVTVKSVAVTEGGDVGEYNITINVPANTSSNNRNFTITATQPSSGKTVTWDAVQAGQATVKSKVAVICTPTFTGTTFARVSYEICFDATNTNKYTGGTLNNVILQLNTKVDGSGTVIATKTLFSSLTVSAGECSETMLGTLNNNTGSSLIYFLVYFDNKLQYKTMPMSNADLQEPGLQ